MKIKISTNSWHYRWQKFLGECFNNRFYPSASICGYFWGFWLNNGAALFVVVILTLWQQSQPTLWSARLFWRGVGL